MKHLRKTVLVLLLALAPAMPAIAAEPGSIASVGTLNRLDTKTGKVNISHEPIPALGWPAMTMEFRVADTAQLKNLKSGDRVTFELKKQDNQYVVTHLRPAG